MWAKQFHKPSPVITINWWYVYHFNIWVVYDSVLPTLTAERNHTCFSVTLDMEFVTNSQTWNSWMKFYQRCGERNLQT